MKSPFKSFWKALTDKSIGSDADLITLEAARLKALIADNEQEVARLDKLIAEKEGKTKKESIAQPLDWDKMVADIAQKANPTFKNYFKALSFFKDGGVSMGGTPEGTGSGTGDYENSELRMVDPFDSGEGLGETTKATGKFIVTTLSPDGEKENTTIEAKNARDAREKIQTNLNTNSGVGWKIINVQEVVKSIHKGQLADELKQAEKELQRLSSNWNGEDSVGMFEGSKVYWEEEIGELEDKVARLKRLQQLNHTKSIIGKHIGKFLQKAKCHRCKGTGSDPTYAEDCIVCNGTGKAPTEKMVGTNYAGPVPNSKLAEQDLEGGSESTTKGIDKKKFIIYSTNEGNGLEFWVKDHHLEIEVGPFKDRKNAEKYVNDQVAKSHPDPKDDPDNRKPEDDETTSTSKSNGRSEQRKTTASGKQLIGVIEHIDNNHLASVSVNGKQVAGPKKFNNESGAEAWLDQYMDMFDKSDYAKTCVLEHIDDFLAEEVDAQQGYRQAAQETSNLEIADLLNAIADDELGHQDVLQEIKDMEKAIGDLVGKDVITPRGYGEIVEELSYDQVLVEFPNRQRQVYKLKEIKVVQNKSRAEKSMNYDVTINGMFRTVVKAVDKTEAEKLAIAEYNKHYSHEVRTVLFGSVAQKSRVQKETSDEKIDRLMPKCPICGQKTTNLDLHMQEHHKKKAIKSIIAKHLDGFLKITVGEDDKIWDVVTMNLRMLGGKGVSKKDAIEFVAGRYKVDKNEVAQLIGQMGLSFSKENYHNGEGYIDQEVMNRNEKIGYKAGDPPTDSQDS